MSPLVNKLMGNAAGEAEKFYTSDFHKENLNKIIGSNKPLVIGKEKDMAASIKTSFKTGEYIYGTAYLGINAKDAMNGNDDFANLFLTISWTFFSPICPGERY